MLKEAILHRADSDMCYLTDDGKMIITLKAKKNDLDKVVLLYDDRYDTNPKREMIREPLVRAISDELYDYFQVSFRCKYTRLSYYFLIIDKEGSHTYFYQDGFSDTYSWGRQRLFQMPYLHGADTPGVPKWLKESVMYQVFPDSFANSKNSIDERPASHIVNGVEVKSRFGGTLRGIIENLPYIEELGVTLLYLNPVFTANSYHKYDEVDYYKVDPCFGTNEELKELVKRCHEKGIKVMLDIVFNQSSNQFFAFQDVLKNGQSSPYADWYHIHDFPVKMGKMPNYETFAFYDVMPKFKTDNEEVENYLIDIGKFWIKECDVDGYRLDVANEISHTFWRNFRTEMDKVKGDFALIGEVWHDAASWIGKDQFHSVMNYHLMYAIWEFFGLDSINAYEFSQKVNRLTMLYPLDNIEAMMNFLDTHDTGRFLSIAKVNPDRQKLAAAFLMSYKGLPSIYYGDEKAIEGHDINDSRRKMIWNDDERSASMYHYYRKIIDIRRKNTVLTYGNYRPLLADIKTNLFGFVREDENDQIICLFNNTSGVQELTFSPDSESYTDLISGESFQEVKGTLYLKMEPYTAKLLKRDQCLSKEVG